MRRQKGVRQPFPPSGIGQPSGSFAEKVSDPIFRVWLTHDLTHADLLTQLDGSDGLGNSADRGAGDAPAKSGQTAFSAIGNG
jgi:hypothetical protein